MRRSALCLAAGLALAACHHGAPPPPAMPYIVGPSLYGRLGGERALRAVVDTFVATVAADDRINAFFRGVDMPQLKQLLFEQICQAAGGPCTYTGRPMSVAHAGLDISNEQFDALVGDLATALDAFRVGTREKTELLSALADLRGEIVGR